MAESNKQPGRVLQAIGSPARLVRKIEATRRPFAWACWTIVAVVVAWDILLTIDPIDGNTWSEITRAAGARHPIVPWLLGAVAAHLFHHRDDLPPIVDRDAASTIMVSLTLLFGLLGFLKFQLPWPMGVTALLGIAAGYLLTPRKRTQVWNW